MKTALLAILHTGSSLTLTVVTVLCLVEMVCIDTDCSVLHTGATGAWGNSIALQPSSEGFKGKVQSMCQISNYCLVNYCLVILPNFRK